MDFGRALGRGLLGAVSGAGEGVAQTSKTAYEQQVLAMREENLARFKQGLDVETAKVAQGLKDESDKNRITLENDLKNKNTVVGRDKSGAPVFMGDPIPEGGLFKDAQSRVEVSTAKDLAMADYYRSGAELNRKKDGSTGGSSDELNLSREMDALEKANTAYNKMYTDAGIVRPGAPKREEFLAGLGLRVPGAIGSQGGDDPLGGAIGRATAKVPAKEGILTPSRPTPAASPTAPVRLDPMLRYDPKTGEDVPTNPEWIKQNARIVSEIRGKIAAKKSADDAIRSRGLLQRRKDNMRLYGNENGD